MKGYRVGGWTDPRTVFNLDPLLPWYRAYRMRWKPWRWEVRQFAMGQGYSVVVKRNLTKVSARGFIKLLSGE